MLDHLTRDIEREVGGIDDPADKAQVAGKNVSIVGDEHAFDVELDAAFAVGIEQIVRPRAGDESERRVFLASLGAEMNGEGRLVELPGDAAIEVGIVGSRDLGPWLGPECGAVGDLSGLRAGLLDNRDRHGHVPGLGLDDPFERMALGIVAGIVHQMEQHARAPRRRVGQRNR